MASSASLTLIHCPQRTDSIPRSPAWTRPSSSPPGGRPSSAHRSSGDARPPRTSALSRRRRVPARPPGQTSPSPLSPKDTSTAPYRPPGASISGFNGMGSQKSQKGLQASFSPSLRDQGPPRTFIASARLPSARMPQAHQFPSSGLRTSIALSPKDIGEYRAAHGSFPIRSGSRAAHQFIPPVLQRNRHPISPVLFLHPLSSGTSIANQSTIEIQQPLCLRRSMPL